MRTAAKAVYAVASVLLRVRVPHHYHGLPAAKNWYWEAPELAFRALRWSEDLDREHWEHWALIDNEPRERCTECGGQLHTWDDVDLDA